MSLAPAQTASAVPTENLAGLVERVTFHNEENGFCVLRLKARGQRDLVTVIGHAAMISAGEWIQAAGTWTNDRTHGLQFRAAFLKATPPTTIEGIERYLGSGMIRGIGPAYAKRLVKAFGETVFDVIEADPGRLREVEGIGPVRAARIAAGWAEQKVVREIMLFLHAHGVGTSRAMRIYKTYGAEAVAVISENPYRLARDIRGIGFKTADQIAAKLGIAKDAMVRVRAGVSYALAEAMDEGHCGLPEDDLLRTGAELLEVTADRLMAALALELGEGAVVADTVGDRRCIFLAGLYRAERDIAERLQSLVRGEPPWPVVDVDKAIPWLESRGGLTLAPSQQEALRLAVASKALVITGGPGVGKTTLVNSILKVLVAKSVNVALGAPTGRAAKRLTETTGVEAKTIHRLLETDPKTGGFKRDETNPLACDLLVVDETSMVDVLLMKALVRALPPRAALLLVGDVDQLPSVGPGQVLADVIGSGAVPVVRLTEVFRQAATSRVIVNAHRINAGQMTDRRIIESLQPLSGNEHVQLSGVGVTTEQREGIRRRIAFHDALAAETKAINALSAAEKVRDDMQAAADAAALGDGRCALAAAIAAHAETVKAGGVVRAKAERARGALVSAQAAHRAADTALAEARERAIGALTAEDGAQPPELKALRRAVADAADDVDIAAAALTRAEAATDGPDYAERKAREAVEAAADAVLSLGFYAAIAAAREAAARMARLAWLADALGGKTPGYGGEGYRRQQEAAVLNPGMCAPSDRRQAIYDGVRAEVAAARAALFTNPAAKLPEV